MKGSVIISFLFILLLLRNSHSLNITTRRLDSSSSSSSTSEEVNCNFFNRIFKGKECRAQAAASSSSLAAAVAAAASSSANSQYQGSYNAYYDYYSSSSASISLAQQTQDISYCTRSRDCNYLSTYNSLLLGSYGTYDYDTSYTYYNYYNNQQSSSSGSYSGYYNSFDYCCMYVTFIDKNGDDREHRYCERDVDGVDDLYFKFYQAAGLSEIDTRCVDIVKLEWYIIVFAIVLPIVICIIIIALVIYFCWEQNAFSHKAKRAKLYEQTLDNTMNHTATPNNYYDLKLELEKAGVLRTDLSAAEQDKAIEELAKRVAKHSDQGDYFTRQAMEHGTTPS